MNKKGFTLIELLVVVAIIAVLAAISVVALNNARARARDSKRLADIKQIQTALELYFLDNDEYPGDSGLFTPSTGYVIIEGRCMDSDNGLEDADCTDTVYMARVPTAPEPHDGSCTASTNDYYYSRPTKKKYCLRYCLGSDSGGIGAGINTATPEGIWKGSCP